MKEKIAAIIAKIANNYDGCGSYTFEAPIDFGEYKIISVCNNVEFVKKRQMVTWNPENETLSISLSNGTSLMWLYGGLVYEDAIEQIYKSFVEV